MLCLRAFDYHDDDDDDDECQVVLVRICGKSWCFFYVILNNLLKDLCGKKYFFIKEVQTDLISMKLLHFFYPHCKKIIYP